MWDAIKGIVTDQPLLILLVLIIGAVLVFSGRMKVNIRGVHIGAADKEREVLHEQFKWLHTYCTSRITHLRRYAYDHGLDFERQDPHEYFAKYICERVYDLCIQWAVLNHVHDTKEYTELKQEEIWDLICLLKPHPIYLTAEFREELDGWVKEVIARLLRIRRTYHAA